MNYLDEIPLETLDADQYDELPLWSAPFGLLLLERVPMKTGFTYLDVGAGTGFLTVELAQRCGPKATVIAVDPWKAAMTRLRKKLDLLGLRNVQVLEQDAALIDLPDASVDVIVSNLGINNFENAEAVLQRCRRAAKPGASLLLTTNLMGHMREFYDVFETTLVDLGQRDRLPLLEAHVRHRATLESLSQRTVNAGFDVRESVTSEFRMRFADGSSLLRHYVIRFGFLPAWKSIPAPDRLRETFAALESNLNTLAAAKGDLALTIPTALVEAQARISR